MRTVLYIVGTFGIVFGVFTFMKTHLDFYDTSFWSYFLTGTASVMGGFIVFFAGVKNYRGHWPFVLGIVFIVVSFLAFGPALDQYRVGSSLYLSVPVGFGIFFSCTGIILLFVGRRLNRCITELEIIQETPIAQRQEIVQDTASPNLPIDRNYMRVVLYIVGILEITFGAVMLSNIDSIDTNSRKFFLTGISAVVSGFIVFFAGVKNYRGHWPFVLGIVFILVSIAAFGSVLEQFRDGNLSHGDIQFAFFGLFFFCTGILLLFSGQRLHRCVTEIEMIRQMSSGQSR